MNCKQGDLAIVVNGEWGSNSQNLGKIVVCKKLLPAGFGGLFDPKNGAIWETNIPMHTTNGERVYYQFDENLRPLRGDLSNDEIDTETPIIKETEKC